ncbi:MAG: hypothetical protein A2W25_04365 [candidate division Zixibacteria bacterium RBG_16_53_22]|nr:MAG: hypothetical protein A2W25_04365 [candidate division Zixibacteria bacterium RBG_16_53_22]
MNKKDEGPMEFTVNLSWVLNNMADKNDNSLREALGQERFEEVYKDVASGKIPIMVQEWLAMKFVTIMVKK